MFVRLAPLVKRDTRTRKSSPKPPLPKFKTVVNILWVNILLESGRIVLVGCIEGVAGWVDLAGVATLFHTQVLQRCFIHRCEPFVVLIEVNILLESGRIVLVLCSPGWYVVMKVFDDGDITTLRRTALCLKSGRHFAESETLDQLPLTHPEHFSSPVVVERTGRRSRQTHNDSVEDEVTPKKGKQKEEKEADIGKVVCVELGDKKKQKDNWFPGLVVAPTAQDTVRIRVKEEYLVRSFKDGRYFTVPKKEATEFTKEIGGKVDNNTLKTAAACTLSKLPAHYQHDLHCHSTEQTGHFTITNSAAAHRISVLQASVEKALLFLDKDELPPHWDRDLLFGLDDSSGNSDSDAGFDSDEWVRTLQRETGWPGEQEVPLLVEYPEDSEISSRRPGAYWRGGCVLSDSVPSSDDEPREEKDHFVAQLYKFMDDRGTPINKGPTIGSRDVDLYKLFKASELCHN
uniref:ARID domain-containing protein n=1 Tax=Timema tahoe TaxID=61484 RepID=A0A7R9NZ79_9NEOP|nr:unnamed protein product [Timema tahoe]